MVRCDGEEWEMKNYQKYVNGVAIIAVLGWVVFCITQNWY